MKAREAVKPNFFIIGAPRCGTTAMSEYLRSHPNVFFSGRKEPKFFATDFHNRLVTKESAYLRIFRKADRGKHIAIGEGSVCYLFSNVAVSKILAFQPNARFIVMIRNPIELVQSLHKQNVKVANDTISSFKEAWEREPDRRQGKFIPLGCPEPKLLFYSEWGRLGTRLRRLFNIVPRRRVHVIVFDDFVRNPREIYVDTLQFLGLPDDGRTQFPKINEGVIPRFLLLQRVSASAAIMIRPLLSALGITKGTGIRRRITSWCIERPNAEIGEYDPAILPVLFEFYQDEIALLSRLLNRDFNHWVCR